jgi:hypothetical protein
VTDLARVQAALLRVGKALEERCGSFIGPSVLRSYATLAAKLPTESDINIATSKILRCIEKEQEWTAANALIASYRPSAPRLPGSLACRAQARAANRNLASA